MGDARPKTGSPHHFVSLARGFSLALIALVALLGTACSRTAPGGRDAASPTATGETGETGSTGVQRSTVVELCSQFTVAALSSDTTVDRGPADARSRAAQQFGTPELIGQLGGEGRDQTWPLLVQHKARVVVDTSEVQDDPPPARGNQVGAAVSATRVAVGADRWRQELPGTVAYCSLVNEGTGWRVAAISFSDSTSSEAPR